MSGVGVHVLHLNLNTADGPAGQRFYESLLGLDMRVRTDGDDFDWRFHGIAEPVSSTAWFLYDDRGPRASPGLELVQWNRPATAGSAYASLAHRGASSVRFRVPRLDGLAAATAEAGGTVVGMLGEAGLLVRDPDGVYVELLEADAPDVRLAGPRIGCADLDASLQWYAALSFAPLAPSRTETMDGGGAPTRARTATVALADRSVTLELTQWLEPVAMEPAETRLWHRGMVRMAVSVEDLDSAMSVLRSAGLTVPEPQTFPMPGSRIDALRVLFLTDPDGFTVELVHRPARHFTAG